MNQFDREILQFVLAWAAYGGPPEDEVLPRFGMSAERLNERVSEILSQTRVPDVSSDDRTLLTSVAALGGCGLHREPVSTSKHMPAASMSPKSVGDDRRKDAHDQPILRRGVWRWP